MIARILTKNSHIKTLHNTTPTFYLALAKFLDFDELNDGYFYNDLNDE